MASSDDNDSSVWENTGETIKDVAYKHDLPALVKVSEGYYGDTDAETFSSGDLIKLDMVKTLIKVSAFIGECEKKNSTESADIDVNDLHWKNEILIPLGYKGKLQVIRSDHVASTFDTVRDLIAEFPRFVRVENDTIVKGADCKFTIPAESELELDRVLPGQGLVCRYGEKECLLDIGDTGKFVSIPDFTLYTLREVIDKLPLPQYVKFVEREFEQVMTDSLDEALENIQNFSGALKLQDLITQRVIVGHHKPVDESSNKTTFCERSLVLLPLDSPIVDEIEVLTPTNKDTEEYEILLTRNFSKDVNVGQIDGGLYLEMRNTRLKIQRFSQETGDKPPPIPPRPRIQNQDTKGGTNIPARMPISTDKSKIPETPQGNNEGSVLSDEDVAYDNADEYVYPDVTHKTTNSVRKANNPYSNRPLPLTPHQTELENIPVGKVTPRCTKSEKSTFKFNLLTVNELADLFEKCELKHLAKLCRKELLDGAFFNVLTDDDLMNKPFNLNSIHLIKYKRAKNGWVPKHSNT